MFTPNLKMKLKLWIWLFCFVLISCESQDSLIPEENPPEVSARGNPPAYINLTKKVPAGSLKIAVIGDSRGGNNVFEDIEEDIVYMKPKPDLVAHTGDMITHPGSGIEWYSFHKDAETLTKHFPFYPIPGNHDVKDQVSQEIYQNQFPPPVSDLYYSVEAGDILLIFLDSEVAGELSKIDGAQYQWLKNLLEGKGAKFRYRLAFVHRPLFPSAEHMGGSLDHNPELRDRLHQLFVKNRVEIVFAGHEHIYDRRKIDSVTYITTAGAGAPLVNDPRSYYHFVFLAETPSGLEGFCFTIDGIMKDHFLVKE